jgi:hypothetical protein
MVKFSEFACPWQGEKEKQEGNTLKRCYGVCFLFQSIEKERIESQFLGFLKPIKSKILAQKRPEPLKTIESFGTNHEKETIYIPLCQYQPPKGGDRKVQGFFKESVIDPRRNLNGHDRLF